MQISTRSIAIVVDEEFGSRLLSLATRTRVWAVDSVPNRRFADRLSEKARALGEATGVTLVRAAEGADGVQTCLDMLYRVEAKHGVYTSNPPYGEIELIGVSEHDAGSVRQELERLGFSVFEPTSNGLRAFRRSLVPVLR